VARSASAAANRDRSDLGGRHGTREMPGEAVQPLRPIAGHLGRGPGGLLLRECVARLAHVDDDRPHADDRPVEPHREVAGAPHAGIPARRRPVELDVDQRLLVVQHPLEERFDLGSEVARHLAGATAEVAVDAGVVHGREVIVHHHEPQLRVDHADAHRGSAEDRLEDGDDLLWGAVDGPGPATVTPGHAGGVRRAVGPGAHSTAR
jgi:hypothetical protein